MGGGWFRVACKLGLRHQGFVMLNHAEPPIPDNRSARDLLWYAVGPFLISGAMIAFIYLVPMLHDAQFRADLAQHGARAPGVITNLARGKGAREDIEFQFTINGKRVEVVSYCCASSTPEWDHLSREQALQVAYDPADHSRAIPMPFPTIPQRDIGQIWLTWFALTLGLTVAASLLTVLRAQLDARRAKAQ